MGITYNKKLVTKDRSVVSKGPRDMQLRQQLQHMASEQPANDVVKELKAQINELQNRLSQPNGSYTAEQVNELITKTVLEQTAQMKEMYQREINSLRELIKHKDELISQLRAEFKYTDSNKLTDLLAEATKKIEEMSYKLNNYEQKVSDGGEVVGDRPKMETVFIDPIEKETTMEKHFDAEDVVTHKKEQHTAKASKLKSLLGGLPKKS